MIHEYGKPRLNDIYKGKPKNSEKILKIISVEYHTTNTAVTQMPMARIKLIVDGSFNAATHVNKTTL
jgi:hypothetical protein